MKKAHDYAVIVLLCIISLLTLGFLSVYLRALILAAVLSGIFSPIYKKFNTKLKLKKALSGTLTVFVLIGTVLIPLSILGVIVTKQAVSISKSTSKYFKEATNEDNAIIKKIYHSTYFENIYATEEEFIISSQEWMKSAAKTVASSAQKFTSDVANWVIRFFIFLFAFYFFLIDGKSYLSWVTDNLPFTQQEKELLVNNFVVVASATLKSTLIISAIQGTIGGITMYFLGVPHTALLWILMMFASIIPSLGPAIIWIPVSIYLYFTGDHTSAIILTVVGAGFIGLVDNFLRPILVGRDVRMPELMVLLSTIGGIAVYGVAGIVIGPIIAALFITTWEIFGNTFTKTEQQRLAEQINEKLPDALPKDDKLINL